jgi:hypothetical protein
VRTEELHSFRRARIHSERTTVCFPQQLTHLTRREHVSALNSVSNTTDCKGRLLAYEYGLSLIPDRAPMPEVFDALELAGCGVTPPPPRGASQLYGAATKSFGSRTAVVVGSELFVDYVKGSDVPAGGSEAAPLKTLA